MRGNGAAKGRATMKARANVRWQRIEQYSAAMVSKQEVASILGITVAGINSALQKHTGSKRWPITPPPCGLAPASSEGDRE